MTDRTDRTESESHGRRFGGRQFVLVLYALLVAFAGVAGVLFSTVVRDPVPPVLFFLVELPPTAVGFAVYGAVTIAIVLGVPLALVVVVSEHIDDEHALDDADEPRDGAAENTEFPKH